MLQNGVRNDGNFLFMQSFGDADQFHRAPGSDIVIHVIDELDVDIVHPDLVLFERLG